MKGEDVEERDRKRNGEKIIETAERGVLIRDNAVGLNLMEIDGCYLVAIV